MIYSQQHRQQQHWAREAAKQRFEATQQRQRKNRSMAMSLAIIALSILGTLGLFELAAAESTGAQPGEIRLKSELDAAKPLHTIKPSAERRQNP